MQQIYSDPTFQMACDQFRLIAEHLQIPKKYALHHGDLAGFPGAESIPPPHRLAALAIGVERVVKARQDRGLFP